MQTADRRKTWTGRPTYDHPTFIPYEKTSTLLWGDDSAGHVSDWVYVSTDKIHHLVFGLAPGDRFQHSEKVRTIFNSDEVLYVLSGKLVIVNPETGETHKIDTGEAVAFRRNTWHHGISFGTDALRVLEFFSPTPRMGATSAYAMQQELLTDIRYIDDRWLGEWPMNREDQRTERAMIPLTDSDLLWHADQGTGQALTGLYMSTENLTVGKTTIVPGGNSDERVHPGELAVHVTKGQLHVLLIDGEDETGQKWFELDTHDGFYIPEGIRHQFRNVTAQPAEFMFGVAPGYR